MEQKWWAAKPPTINVAVLEHVSGIGRRASRFSGSFPAFDFSADEGSGVGSHVSKLRLETGVYMPVSSQTAATFRAQVL